MKSGKAAPRKKDSLAPKRKVTRMVTVQNINVPGHSSRVNAEKYEAMRRALSACPTHARSWFDASRDVQGSKRAFA